MVVIRRRLIFWLIKAYIKKSKKILIFSFFAGLLIFFAILFGAKYIRALLTLQRPPVIGITGSYETDELPPIVVEKLSKGLTRVEENGTVRADLAESYTVKDSGKTYEFKLKKNLKFNDGSNFESHALVYNFSDVSIERPDKYTIVFKLKDAYTPFLSTMARPAFNKKFVGVGDYYVKDIELNGNFVRTLTLALKGSRFDTVKFLFYPTETALKNAFALGEITQATGLTRLDFKSTSFENYPKVTIVKKTNYSRMVALFYNTIDPVLSDTKMRLALNYALPERLQQGEKATLPYSPKSIYFNKELEQRRQDYEHAKVLLTDKNIKVKIVTLNKYLPVAKEIAKSWEKVGIKTEIEEVDGVPDQFQIFLGDFNLPNDPDQYTLWHTGQNSNITRYKDLRIDKLLEDGRKTVNTQDRRKIYYDFQKFLMEDMPASFLYFPTEYDVIRS
jgi:peptide/nickel transport system substrate-binding protein